MDIHWTKLGTLSDQRAAWPTANRPPTPIWISFSSTLADPSDRRTQARSVGKTITYEAAEVTAVLDLDENGFLVGIELV